MKRVKARVMRKWKRRQASNWSALHAEEPVTTSNAKPIAPGAIPLLKTVTEIK